MGYREGRIDGGEAGHEGNGEVNIWQHRSDGRWEDRLTLPNGRSKGFDGRTRADVARRIAAAIRARAHGMPATLDEPQTVGQYPMAWLETIRSTTVKPRTHQRYDLAVRVHLIPALGSLRLAKLTAQHVQSFYAATLDAGLAPATVAHLHAVLHRALRAAERLVRSHAMCVT